MINATSSHVTRVRTTTEDGVLRVVIDRPEKLNALRSDQEIAAIEAAVQTPGVRAIVIAGAGERAFSVGMDINEVLALSSSTDARVFISSVGGMLEAVRTAPVPTICEIDGHCLGAALELALACDIRIATARSSVGLPEIKLGVPSVLDAALLSQYVGLSMAKEMLLLGDTYPVTDPRLGPLCNQIVDHQQLGEVVTAVVRRVIAYTPAAVASQKRLLEVWQNDSLVEGVARSIVEFARVFDEPDTRAAIDRYRAELERRRSAGAAGP